MRACAGLLPDAQLPWSQPEQVAQQAQLYLDRLGLSAWHFAWDRALRRLGSCDGSRRRITLSSAFVAHYLAQPAEAQQLIDRVLRHELAHALACEHHRARGHGAVWKHYCAELGIAGERACTRCDDFVQSHPTKQSVRARGRAPRYALIVRGTGEVIRHYVNRPRRSAEQWASCYVPGRREETLGKLMLVEL